MKISWRELLCACAGFGSVFVVLIASENLNAKTRTSSSVTAIASLVGTWTLTAADDLLPDGSRVHAYGSNPRGLLIFAPDGRYALQIYRDDRAKFASGDKKQGTFDEYREASVGASCHFGHYSVDTDNGTITFKIDRASFANWDGATQIRPFTLRGDDLEWRVPATPDGRIPISGWHRVR